MFNKLVKVDDIRLRKGFCSLFIKVFKMFNFYLFISFRKFSDCSRLIIKPILSYQILSDPIKSNPILSTGKKYDGRTGGQPTLIIRFSSRDYETLKNEKS